MTPRRRELARRFARSFSLTVFLVLFIALFTFGWVNYRSSRARLLSEYNMEVGEIAGELDHRLAMARTSLRLLSQMVDPAELTQERLDRLVVYLLERRISVVTLSFLDSGGNVIASREVIKKAGQLEQGSLQQEIRQHLLRGEEYQSPVYLALVSGQFGWYPMMQLMVPFLDPVSGAPLGGVVLELDLHFIQMEVEERVEDFQEFGVQTMWLYVVGPDRTLLAFNGQGLIGQKVDEEGLFPALAHEIRIPQPRERIYRNDQGDRVIGFIAPMTHGGWVVVELPISESFRQQWPTVAVLLPLLVLGAGLSVFVGSQIARPVVEPLRALEEGVRRLQAGELDYRVRGVETGDELQDLAEAFNTMAEQVQRSQAELQEFARTLEERVHERTRELEETLARQGALLDTIRALRAPVIPVWEGVVAMTLVGEVELERAEEVARALLQAIEVRRARVAILDITGVPRVDHDTASVLVRTAEAVELMGCRPVVTGLRPETAQALTALGIDLSRLVTRSDLQAGIEYALELLRREGMGGVGIKRSEPLLVGQERR